MDRVILHSDCNSFYATVECLYRPEIRDKPVAVGGEPEHRQPYEGNTIAAPAVKQEPRVLFFSNWVVNKGCYPESVSMPVIHCSNGFQKVHMPVSDSNGPAGFSIKLMKVVFVKIRPEFYLMNMIAFPNWNCLTGHSSKPMVMRIFLRLSNLNASLDFMNMELLIWNRTMTMITIYA